MMSIKKCMMICGFQAKGEGSLEIYGTGVRGGDRISRDCRLGTKYDCCTGTKGLRVAYMSHTMQFACCRKRQITLTNT